MSNIKHMGQERKSGEILKAGDERRGKHWKKVTIIQARFSGLKNSK